MKELIRHILKEETDDSKTLEKGLDITIKILKKTYPYIIGWELIQESGEFKIYIKIICDIEKLKKFYNSDLINYYSKYGILEDEDFPYAVSILEINDEMNSNEKFGDFTTLKDDLNGIYEMLPEHLVVKNKYGEIKELDPDRFKFQ
jgi:hypothetical protein